MNAEYLREKNSQLIWCDLATNYYIRFMEYSDGKLEQFLT